MSRHPAAHKTTNSMISPYVGPPAGQQPRRKSAAARRKARARARQGLGANTNKNFAQNLSLDDVRSEIGLSDMHLAALHSFPFFDFMMQPEETPPMRVPDGHAGVTAVFKSPFVVSLPYSGTWNPALAKSNEIDPLMPADGYSEVILVPGSTNCIYHTLGDSATFWAPNGDQHGGLVPCLAAHPSLIDFIEGKCFLSHGLRGSQTVSPGVACLPKRDTFGKPWFELELTPTDDQSPWLIAARATNLVSQQKYQTTFFWEIRFDDDSIEDFEQLIIRSDQDFNITIPVGASSQNSNAKAINFAVSDTDTASHWVLRLEEFDEQGVQGTVGLAARSACGFAVKSAPELDELNETLAERQSALSGLITYVGSTLQDGGQISAARLGLGLSPFGAPGGDVFTYLASLPFYNDDYALRDGIYSWWLPDSIQEHFYRPYRKPRGDKLEEDSVLQFAMRRDNPNQDVRLKSIHCVEVITRSRLYASKPGPVNPAYELMISAMKHAPAVTINSKHKGILSRAFGGIKRWLSKKANWWKLLKYGGDAVSLVSPGAGEKVRRGAKLLQDIVG